MIQKIKIHEIFRLKNLMNNFKENFYPMKNFYNEFLIRDYHLYFARQYIISSMHLHYYFIIQIECFLIHYLFLRQSLFNYYNY